MSQSTLSLTFVITRIPKPSHQKALHEDGRVFTDLRLDSGHIPTEAFGGAVLSHLKNRRQFKAFFVTSNIVSSDVVHRLYGIQPAGKLTVEVQLWVMPDGRSAAETDFPDCRLVHVSHHDGGYTMTIKTLRDAKVEFPTDPDPAAGATSAPWCGEILAV
jgi:hypothetical protein